MAERGCEHFDPYDPELGENFWETMAQLRGRCSMAHSDAHGGFYPVTRYADVWRVLRDPATFSSAEGVAIPRNPEAPLMPPIEADPPLQRDYRRLLNPFFTPAALEPHAPGIREIVTEHIDGFIETGRCDLALDFNQPVPGSVFFKLILGVPLADFPKVHAWMRTIAFESQAPGARDAWASMAHWIVTWLERRRKDPPRGDVVDAILAAELGGERLTPETAMPTVMILIMGGLETTSNAAGNIMRHLAERPELRRLLRERPSMLSRALEEFLRFEAPAVALGRTVTQEVELGGRTLRRGDKVLVYFASANRDGDEFDRPDELVFDRARNRHLAFGGGPHRCIGSNLARLQLRIMLEELIERLGEFRIPAGREVVYATALARGPKSLPLEFPPGPRIGVAPRADREVVA